MDKTTQPQQLSFSFEEPTANSTVVSLAVVQAVALNEPVTAVPEGPAVVYDFRSAMVKRKESVHASLYRQILDSVRHIG